MDHLDFYKELYHKENDRRQEVITSLNIPLAVITALSSGTYFLITSFDYTVETFLTGIFIFFMILTGISLLGAIYFLIRAFSDFSKGYEYSGIPYVNELYNWNKELEQYYETYKEDKDLPKDLFKTYLLENLIKHTDHNMYVNDKKHGFIFRSKKFLILALVLILISLVPFGYNFFKKDREIHKIEVVSDSNNREFLLLEGLNGKLDSLINSQKKKEYEKNERFPQETDTTTTTTTTRQID